MRKRGKIVVIASSQAEVEPLLKSLEFHAGMTIDRHAGLNIFVTVDPGQEVIFSFNLRKEFGRRIRDVKLDYDPKYVDPEVTYNSAYDVEPQKVYKTDDEDKSWKD